MTNSATSAQLEGIELSPPPPHRPSLADRLEHAVGNFLIQSAPWPLRTALTGKPLVIDGQTLHPELQRMLRLRAWVQGEGGLASKPVEVARRQMLRESVAHEGPRIEVGQVHDFSFEARGGRLRARHYAPPRGGGDAPLCVFFHGGGFVLGELEGHDAPCRLLCSRGQMHVLAVDYRLAPEHPFPAAVDDALDVFRFAVAHAEQLGASARCIGVAGDSAGGNLSAVVAQQTRGSGERTPDFAGLIYPAVDRSRSYPSQALFGRGFLLTEGDITVFNRSYFADDPETRLDPRLSPLCADDLVGLCPSVLVTAGFDSLRDEGEAYARALSAAGVQVLARREPALIHGFINLIGVSPACRAATERIVDELRSLAQAQLTA